MRLEDIIRNTGAEIVRGEVNTQVTSICSDSRKVVPGALFVAVKGFATDGHKYIDAALEAGAAAVVSADRRGLAPSLSCTTCSWVSDTTADCSPP